MKTEHKIVSIFSIIVFFITLFGVYSYKKINTVNDGIKWVNHTLDVQVILSKHLSIIQDAETGQRGFVITGHENFLKNYNLAVAQLETSIFQLRNLMKDNHMQLQRLDTLQNLCELKMTFIKENIAIRRKNGFEAAMKIVSNKTGKILMDNIQKTLAAMRNEENRMLQEQTNTTDKSFHNTVTFIVSGSILLIALAVFLMFFIFKDFRKKMQLEKELNIALLRMQKLITNLNAGILVESADHKIVLVNDIFCQIFSIPAKAKQLIGSDCSESAKQVKHLFVNPDFFESDISSLIKNRVKVIGQVLIMKNGNVYERDFIPITVNNQYLGHLWQYKDVTSERLLKESLRINEERLNFAIESNNEGVWEVDIKANTILLTKRCKEMLGYSEDEIGNSMVLWTKLIHPEDLPLLLTGRSTVIKNEAKSFSNEHRQLCKDGNWKWVQVCGIAATRDNKGNALRMIGTYTDISERKQQQEDLQNAKEYAEHLARTKDQFLANMSHEIRTPLNGIIGFTKILLRNRLTEKQRKQMNAVKTSSDILLVLINDILDLAKIEAGKMTLEETELKVADFVNSISAAFKILLEEKELKLTLKYDDLIPKLLFGDPVRINQVLYNLISNAIKFTMNGGNIDIGVNLKEQNEEKAIVEITVSDAGIGIPSKKLATIFEPFMQSSSDTTRRYGGTGLGLSIVKRLVDLMDGTIAVKSKLNEGSTFTVTLPLKKSTEIKRETSVYSTKKIEGLGNLKILIVEDVPTNQFLTETIMHDFGFETAIADNGKIAIELLEKNNYDLILMDLMMPEMDGWETTKHIRRKMEPPKSTIPIIALTADVTKRDMDRCTAVGMNEYVSKPINENELLRKIVLLIDKNKEISNALLMLEQPEVTITNKICNLEHLKTQFVNKPQLVSKMLLVVLKHTPLYLEEANTYLKASNWASFQGSIHKLRPTISFIGLPKHIEDTAKLIDDYANEEQHLDLIPDLFLKVDKAFQQAFKELEEELEIIDN